MKIEDRIQNIKLLLKYCPHSTNDVIIYNDEVANFFSKFLSDNKRFYTPCVPDKPRIKIELAKHVITRDDNDNVLDEYPIMFSYYAEVNEYYDDWETYYFDDPLIRNHWMFSDYISIKYDEIPDHIWEIIQNELYDVAQLYINKELEQAKTSVKNWEKINYRFESALFLNQ